MYNNFFIRFSAMGDKVCKSAGMGGQQSVFSLSQSRDKLPD
jgi:hypothetical protein